MKAEILSRMIKIKFLVKLVDWMLFIRIVRLRVKELEREKLNENNHISLDKIKKLLYFNSTKI